MTLIDVVLMAAILGGAGWLFYRSVWTKKGHCHSCDEGHCKGK